MSNHLHSIQYGSRNGDKTVNTQLHSFQYGSRNEHTAIGQEELDVGVLSVRVKTMLKDYLTLQYSFYFIAA